MKIHCDHQPDLLDCPICHKLIDQCGFGSCQKTATHLVRHPKEGRKMCRKHATAPHFGFARAGCTVEKIQKTPQTEGRSK
tara:strand:- start:5040 stop:5279 length:240 start_codon:yes stop_codon:yes gene_type:complete